jgi:hypothetical protein
MTDMCADPELGRDSPSPEYLAVTDVVPIGSPVVTSVAVHGLRRQNPIDTDPSGATAVPFVAPNDTEPLGVSPSPLSPSTLTVAFSVTADPTIVLPGDAETVVDDESTPAAVAAEAELRLTAPIVTITAIELTRRVRPLDTDAECWPIVPPQLSRLIGSCRRPPLIASVR